MTASNRAVKLAKLHKVLKKHFEPINPVADRTVIEHLLYACCLEDSYNEHADEAFARLQESYFDWNEVRVTTVNELAETLSGVPDPDAAATRVKKSLHAIFETHYSFDLEFLKKENLGKAMQQLDSYKGVSTFVSSYVAQSALGGHSIGIDDSLLELMLVLDVVTRKDVEKRTVPGMERAIPKAKGIEFFSLVHQLAVGLHLGPFSQGPRAIILEVDPGAKERFPKRASKKAVAEKAAKPTAAPKKKAKKTVTKEPVAKPKAKPKAKAPTKKKVTTSSTAKAKKKSPTKTLAKKKPR